VCQHTGHLRLWNVVVVVGLGLTVFFGTVGKFWASRNVLTGTIPAEIGNATELEILELYDNAITGAMPNPICNLVPSAEMGGNLTLLVVDCEVNCTCCTNCQ
jgi:hypothetical protein